MTSNMFRATTPRIPLAASLKSNAAPLTPANLDDRRWINVVTYSLLDTLGALVNVKIRDDLDQAGMPTLGGMISLLEEALAGSLAKALQRLEECAELVQLYSWVFEHGGHLTEALRLRKHWVEVEELLRAAFPDVEREPWEELQDAMRTRLVVR